MTAVDRADELLRKLLALARDISARLERVEAAQATRQRVPGIIGRPMVDDEDSLAEITTLMAQGVGRSTAIKQVARSLGGNIEAHEQRLRRKLSSKTFNNF
jgi:uncharacterized protein YoaH (UPF0181 family)